MGKSSSRRASGDGALYQRTNGMWVATLELGWVGGKRRRWQGASRTQAGALAKLRAARQEIALYGTVAPKALTAGDWLDRWLADVVRPNARPKTFIDYESKVRRHIKPAIGKVRLTDLTPTHVRRMEVDIARTGAVATARSVHRVLSKALADAARDGLVVRNVAAMVVPPRSTAQARPALTVDEARSVLEKAPSTASRARVAVALLLGARQGECLGLQWDRVDLTASTIDISWQLQRLPFRHGCGRDGEAWKCGKTRAGTCARRVLDVPTGFAHEILDGGMCLTRPKTAKGQRIIPLPPLVVSALHAHRKESLQADNPHHLVWTGPAGKPVSSKDDAAVWAGALAAAKVRPVPLHSARHTTATLLMELGVDTKVVQEILGHTDVETSRGYQHVDLALAREAMDRLGEALA